MKPIDAMSFCNNIGSAEPGNAGAKCYRTNRDYVAIQTILMYLAKRVKYIIAARTIDAEAFHYSASQSPRHPSCRAHNILR